MPSEAMEQEGDPWKDWETSGKQAFLQQVKPAIETNDFAVIDKDGNRSPLTKLVYKLFHEGIYGALTPENVVDGCIALSELHDDFPSLIMDMVTVYDSEINSQDSPSADRNKLIRIMVLLVDKWCPELARERLEFETLGEFDQGVKAFRSKFIKVKTRLYYKQNKFNLYREENEGYSKLIMQLNLKNHNVDDPEDVLGNIRSLIGCFSLDPTRVIDIILDNFQLNPFNVDLYVPLLKKYMPEINLLSEVVGFRYLTFNENESTPRALHVMVCVMLHHNVITIDDVYPWLSPDDDEIVKEFEQQSADEKAPKKPLPPLKSKEEFEKHQKLSLCEVAASLGSWKTFEVLLTRLPRKYVLDKPQVATSICKFVHYLIAPVYATHSGFSDKIEGAPLQFEPNPIADPQCQTMSEVVDVVFPILYTLGANLRTDLVLLFKLTRICSTTLSKLIKSQDTNGKLFTSITRLLELSLLPTLSNLQANCCVSEAIWNVVKLYPLQTRYSIYYRWRKYLQDNQSILLKRCEGKVNAVYCLKRVSKENVKQIGRLLGKLSHYSPATLFDYILFLIQVYDNLIGPIVDSLKYMTNMSYDVLGFCIFNSLYNDTKQREKHDGTTVLPWFQSTSQFCATVFKKYNIDLSGILLYTMEQLKCNRSIELLILKEILQKMTGIDITDDMTQHQIDALSGGELLRSEAGYFVQQQNFKKTATRLKEALVENNLVAPLGIMLAQQRNYIIFMESKSNHLKFTGKLYDECHDTLLQYGAFIGGPIMTDTHSSFPSLNDLLLVYKLDLDVAFYLCRPVLHSLACDKKSSSDSSRKVSKKLSATSIVEPFFELIDNLSPAIESLQPSKSWDDISPKFVATFWCLSLYDIQIPLAAYTKEIAKQKEAEASQTKSTKGDTKSHSLSDKLTQEMKDQQQYVKTIIDQLKKRKNEWFLSKSVKPAKNEMITQFLQICIFPRCKLSITDSLFCAQFIHTLHTIETSNFSTLLFYDRLFCDITFAVMSCSENEASRYGRFLCAVLQNIMRWHSSNEIYDKECAHTPGFVTKFRVSNEFSEPNDNVHYENFRHVCHKWHYKITKSLLNLLESGEYVQIRNGLIVLIKLLPTFPVIGKLAQFIEKRINKVREEEKNSRQDLYTLATSYSGVLMSKSSEWLAESDFHIVTTNEPSANSSSSAGDSNSQKEDKLDMETESFSSDLPSELYLSPPSNHSSSPPSSPRATTPSPRETSPVKERSSEKHDAHEKTSDSHRDSSKSSPRFSPDYRESRGHDSDGYRDEDDNLYEGDSAREESDGSRPRQLKRERTPKKDRVDDRERRKTVKRRMKSRSSR
ncbi:hypothetical protein GE061_018723 [Apolygus lucorum]|uniref:THO complex subunit 2 n=1 Tax=Apolygus lucorum TaxID=248454 RepID=A0A6A4JN82_APOLU|nr:hypothetical protein GE061_018723 [Apolygus lucorum]